MGIKARVFTVAGVLSISLLGWWMSDVFIGYLKFKELCRLDGGLKTYGKVEIGTGWLTNNEWVARDVVASYSTVSFARFHLNNGVSHDVIYVGGAPWKDSSYRMDDVGGGVVRYRLDRKSETVSKKYRIRKNSLTLMDLESDAVMLSSTRFILTLTDPKNTLFGMSDMVECQSHLDEMAQIRNYLGAK
ncbi:hypothetical protein [Pseudomonas indica]|uniref:hypothetical protein n=1 Tax=Pseudomonas indica TaxID=137658 RepID=UPI001140A0F9|nr:hypothetical protein [Pseudomonas indica]